MGIVRPFILLDPTGTGHLPALISEDDVWLIKTVSYMTVREDGQLVCWYEDDDGGSRASLLLHSLVMDLYDACHRGRIAKIMHVWPNEVIVGHRDGNPFNCCRENLYYTSPW